MQTSTNLVQIWDAALDSGQYGAYALRIFKQTIDDAKRNMT
jgi:hypothetical protein